MISAQNIRLAEDELGEYATDKVLSRLPTDEVSSTLYWHIIPYNVGSPPRPL